MLKKLTILLLVAQLGSLEASFFDNIFGGNERKDESVKKDAKPSQGACEKLERAVASWTVGTARAEREECIDIIMTHRDGLSSGKLKERYNTLLGAARKKDAAFKVAEADQQPVQGVAGSPIVERSNTNASVVTAPASPVENEEDTRKIREEKKKAVAGLRKSDEEKERKEREAAERQAEANRLQEELETLRKKEELAFSRAQEELKQAERVRREAHRKAQQEKLQQQ